MTFSLVALNGPEPGSVHRLSSDRVYRMGRSPSCAICIDDPSVADVHSQLRFDSGQWRIEDCDSPTGTRVNASIVRDALLQHGDLLTVGGRWLVFSEQRLLCPPPGSTLLTESPHPWSDDALQSPNGSLDLGVFVAGLLASTRCGTGSFTSGSAEEEPRSLPRSPLNLPPTSPLHSSAKSPRGTSPPPARNTASRSREPICKCAGVGQRILGESLAVRQLLEQVEKVAPTDANVLVLGESGTGKELVAQAIHEGSRRGDESFVAVNCAAFSESLLESELFGHEKGAFTGAEARRMGQFERADRGTIFLDEVGELSMGCQAKLLRLLEGQAFHRVGGAEPIKVDVRVVAATHRDLPQMVGQGGFREDLWYRLRVIELRTPALRDRGADVVKLAYHFLEQARRDSPAGPQQLSNEAVALLQQHCWPGNVRELKNAIERAVVLSVHTEIQAADLGLVKTDESDALGRLETLAENELRHILRVLETVGGNKTEACRILEISRGTLYSKLSRV